MKKFIYLHSIIDLITNSSTELFMVDTPVTEGILNDIFNFIIKECDFYNETEIQPFTDYDYKDDYILPDGIKEENVYVFEIDYTDQLLQKLLEKYFTILPLKRKDDY